MADRITFAVGCDPEPLRWSVDLARTARTDTGLDPDGISFGAYVQAAAHPDRSDSDPQAQQLAARLFTDEVMPALR